MLEALSASVRALPSESPLAEAPARSALSLREEDMDEVERSDRMLLTRASTSGVASLRTSGLSVGMHAAMMHVQASMCCQRSLASESSVLVHRGTIKLVGGSSGRHVGERRVSGTRLTDELWRFEIFDGHGSVGVV